MFNKILDVKKENLNNIKTSHFDFSNFSYTKENDDKDNQQNIRDKIDKKNSKNFNVFSNHNKFHDNFNTIPNRLNYINNNKVINQSKFMTVIKGGGGKIYPNKNHFFTKMLNDEKNMNHMNAIFDPYIRDSLKNSNKNKINIDKLQREKFEQELRMLDCDDLNISADSEYKIGSLRENLKNYYNVNKLEDNPMRNRVKTPEKNITNSIWNIFS